MLRWGRWQVSREGLLLILAAVGVVLAVGRCEERQAGAAQAQLAAALTRAEIAERRADSLARAYRVDTVTLWRVKRTTDTLTATVEQWKRDTLEVVRYVTLADSTIRACTAALGTCEARIAAEREGRRALEAATLAALALGKRPWTSVGVAYDATTGSLGGYVERDWTRLRGGVSVTPGRVELRVGVRY